MSQSRSSRSRWRKLKRALRKSWLSYVALLVLAVVTAGVVTYSLSGGKQPPVSETVAKYQSEQAKPTPTKEAAPVAAYLGDSWTSNGKDVGVPAFTSAAFGWTSQPFGQGGTGYLNPGPEANGAHPFSARVDSVVASKPDLVFILGGLNDRGRDYATVDAMTTASGSLYDSLAQKLPAAQLVVVGPYYPGDQVPADLLAIRDLLKSQAGKRGLPFIDPIEGGWITGMPDAPGSGNAPGFIANSHPNEAGMRHLADKLTAAIKAEPALAKFTS